MKNFTQKFIGILVLVFTMSFTVNAQDNSGCDLVEFVSWPTNAAYGSTVSIASPNQWSFTQPGYEAIVIQGNGGQLIVEFTNLDGSYTGNGVGGYWSSVDEIASVFGRTVAPNILPRLESNEFVFNHVGPYYVTTSSPNPTPSVTPDLLQSNAALTACVEMSDPAACEDAASQFNFSGDPNELMMDFDLFFCVNSGDDFMCEMVIAEYFNESCSSVQSISIGFTQADVDAAFADGVASVEVPECEEVATQNMPLDLPQGWSMFGYTCLESLDVVEAFSGVSNNIEIVKDEWGLAYLPAWGFSAFDNLEFGEGYQIKMIEAVTDFQFCTTIAGGASQEELDAAYAEGAASVTPEDGIGQDDVDAAYVDGAASVTPEDGIGQDDVDAAYVDGAASVTPEDGIGQDDVDAAFDDGWNEGVASVTPEDGISQADVDAAVAEVEANFAASLSVGDFYQGGIVFQINEDGTGLVSAQEDLEGTYEWGCYGVSVDGADSKFIGSGLQNTMDIISQGCTTENGSTIAAQAALDAEVTGYSDWYLPSKDELTEMYNTIGNGGPEGNIGGFENSFYWSSSENDYYNIGALSVNFLDGYSDSYYKSNSYRVRVIRAF